MHFMNKSLSRHKMIVSQYSVSHKQTSPFYYFRQGGYVFGSVGLFVCLFVCLSPRSLKNFHNFDKISWRGQEGDKEQVIRFW